ncbi:MAG: diphosphomevalonate decarboxylase [Saprospiraceae bacterium]|nr:diphosphomevalonate decarboxylase [Saprospiraceae bacterium]
MKANNNSDTPDGFSGRIGWQCPSNLAIIKYWGKYGRQLPKNPSISFTLSEAATRTFIDFHKTDQLTANKLNVRFRFEGVENKPFSDRITLFLSSIYEEFFSFLPGLHLNIESSNSFPHSSGIASSASSMGALALCLCDIEWKLSGKEYDDSFYQKASLIARLGSGSACRSIYSGMALWGAHADVVGSSDLYAIPFEDKIHPVFKTFHDDILIVSSREKSVSSSAGHSLMNNNVYAPARYEQANLRLIQLIAHLKQGDVSGFGNICEDEALTLHALMMCSDPSYMLMESGTVAIIQKIRQFRFENNIPVYFSLDAGPNIHLLYPDEFRKEVSLFLNSELLAYCEDGRVIRDKVGSGPQKLI